MLPSGRSHMYAEWRACERFGILPPGMSAKWDDLHPWFQIQLVAYDQIRQIEDAKYEAALAGAKVGR